MKSESHLMIVPGKAQIARHYFKSKFTFRFSAPGESELLHAGCAESSALSKLWLFPIFLARSGPAGFEHVPGHHLLFQLSCVYGRIWFFQFVTEFAWKLGSYRRDDDSLPDVKIMGISNCLSIGFVNLAPFRLGSIVDLC